MANYIYGLTVQGIQSYIFATNNLREIIGAGEILENLCTTAFTDYCDEKDIKGIPYQQAASNIRFQTTKENAELIFKEFHKILLRIAPGVPFSQAVVKDGDIDELERKLNGQRNLPMQNYDLGCMGRLIARSTGDAAVSITDSYQIKKRGSIDKTNNEKFIRGGYSYPSLLEKKINCLPEGKTFIKEFEELAKDSNHSWLALVHIDVNGMGNRIRQIKTENPGSPFEKIKEFSDKVQQATKDAFNHALKNEVVDKIDENKIPFRPIVLGGDDITVIMKANLALPFVNTYLKTFDDKTENELKEFGGKLTACAGIAYVKDKFPFHYSADLAEDLCKHAKIKSNREYSCVQFHKVLDSFVESYDEIIERELTTVTQSFTNGPYYLVDNIIKDSKSNKVPSVENFLKDCTVLSKAEKSPINGMREWVDMAFNNPDMAEVISERLDEKYTTDFKTIISNKPAYIDYLSIMAVS